MGGWVVAQTAAHDHGLVAVIMISAADMGGHVATQPGDKVIAEMAENMEALAGVTAESMARELQTHVREFRLDNVTAGLTQVPLLMLTSDDGLAPGMDAFVATDHGWSDRRVALEGTIINWLAAY
jgi:hypothetical protein